jgi:hypothetical protein
MAIKVHIQAGTGQQRKRTIERVALHKGADCRLAARKRLAVVEDKEEK